MVLPFYFGFLLAVFNDGYLAKTLLNFHNMEPFTCQYSKKLAKVFLGYFRSASLASLWKVIFAILFAILAQ